MNCQSSNLMRSSLWQWDYISLILHIFMDWRDFFLSKALEFAHQMLLLITFFLVGKMHLICLLDGWCVSGGKSDLICFKKKSHVETENCDYSLTMQIACTQKRRILKHCYNMLITTVGKYGYICVVLQDHKQVFSCYTCTRFVKNQENLKKVSHLQCLRYSPH